MKRFFLLIALVASTTLCMKNGISATEFVSGEKFNAVTKELQTKNPSFYGKLKWDNPEGIQFDCMANIYMMSSALWQEINKELGQ